MMSIDISSRVAVVVCVVVVSLFFSLLVVGTVVRDVSENFRDARANQVLKIVVEKGDSW